MVTVRPATYEDSRHLVVTFARAFEKDPMMDCLIRADARRREGMELFFRQCLNKLTLPYGMVLATDDCQGGAMWLPSENVHVGFISQSRLLPDMVRAAGWRRLPVLIDFMQRLDQLHPRGPHYYLMFVAVCPDSQRRGYGAGLIRPVLERCDREGRPAYLENSNPANQHFYEQLGFRMTGEIPVKKGGPYIYSMWRDPRKAI